MSGPLSQRRIKMGELTALAEEKRVDILCIQIHHIYHENVHIEMKDMGKGLGTSYVFRHQEYSE